MTDNIRNLINEALMNFGILMATIQKEEVCSAAVNLDIKKMRRIAQFAHKTIHKIEENLDEFEKAAMSSPVDN